MLQKQQKSPKTLGSVLGCHLSGMEDLESDFKECYRKQMFPFQHLDRLLDLGINSYALLICYPVSLKGGVAKGNAFRQRLWWLVVGSWKQSLHKCCVYLILYRTCSGSLLKDGRGILSWGGDCGYNMYSWKIKCHEAVRIKLVKTNLLEKRT